MLAMTYGCRPSAILGIPDEWAAYQFDVAAYTVGQQELNEQRRQARGKRNGNRDRDDAQPMPTSVLRGLLKT